MNRFSLGAVALLAASPALAQDPAPAAHSSHLHEGPDGNAPIGVMGDHTHGAGHWMLSYRYGYAAMEGNRRGTAAMTPAEVRAAGYRVVPTDMDMHMHMFGAMYAPADQVTVAFMLPVMHMSMRHLAGMPLGATRFTTRATGLGDASLTGLFPILDGAHHLHIHAGVSLPTGSVHIRDDTPAASNVRLPYPMRPGTGSLGFLPGLTYTGRAVRVSWGAQFRAMVPLHANEDGYRVGAEWRGTAWIAYRFTDWLSASLRAAALHRGNIHGADPDMDATMVPTADTRLRARTRLDALLGLGLAFPGLPGHRLALELGLPAYQHLDGPQLETDWTLGVGWQWTVRGP